MAKTTAFEIYIGKKENRRSKSMKVPTKTNPQIKEISFSGQMKPVIDKKLDKVFDAQNKRMRMRKK